MKFIYLIATFASVALAAPTQTISQRDVQDWTPALGQYYSLVARHIQEARDAPSFPNPPVCDMSKITLPTATTPLPAPAGLKLAHVALGRGIQNYSCSAQNAQTTPVPLGAVASLFNASCTAALYPDLLEILPTVALEYGLPSEANANILPANLIPSGKHFFSNATTAVFDLSATPNIKLGEAVVHKNASSNAPTDSLKGQGNIGDGAVPWLYLTTIENTPFPVVYRLTTAGGNPPKDCSNSPATFSVQYAANYYFFTN